MCAMSVLMPAESRGFRAPGTGVTGSPGFPDTGHVTKIMSFTIAVQPFHAAH